MRSLNECDTEEQEYDAVTRRTATKFCVSALLFGVRFTLPQHLDEIFDGCVGLLRDVFEAVVRLHEAAGNQAHDPGPVEQLGREVGEHRHSKDGERLDN